MSSTTDTRFVRQKEEHWKDYFEGWLVVDAACISADLCVLLARQNVDPEIASRGWDHDVPTRMIRLYYDGRCGDTGFEGYGFPKVGSCQYPLRQGLISNRNSKGQIYAIGSGTEGEEFVYPSGGSSDIVSIQRLKRIRGWIYAVSRFRRIFKRTEVGRWDELSAGLELLPHEEKDLSLVGFNDIDGLSHDNLYAVGGRGDVFHFDGQRWTRCDFPSNAPLYTVTVGPDGTAYITSLDGSIWAGQHDTWRLADKAEHGIEYNDSVWFNGQLWLCSDYQLHVWDGHQRRRPRWQGRDVVHSGHMDALDGVLVVAGRGTVHAFDGEDWHVLVWPYPAQGVSAG